MIFHDAAVDDRRPRHTARVLAALAANRQELRSVRLIDVEKGTHPLRARESGQGIDSGIPESGAETSNILGLVAGTAIAI